MSRFWDEQFEATGYDETWSEGVTGTTIDPNADPADVSSPSSWDTKSMKITCAGGSGNEVYLKHVDGSTYAVTYYRLEIVVTAESLSNGNQNYVLWIYRDSSFANAFTLFITQVSANLYFKLNAYHNGSANNYQSLADISIGTRYRVELMWNATANTWAWKIDGVAQPNNVDGSDPVESEGTLTDTHATTVDAWAIGQVDQEDGAALTAYYDLFAIDDADWVGAEPGPAGGIVVLRRRRM